MIESERLISCVYEPILYATHDIPNKKKGMFKILLIPLLVKKSRLRVLNNTTKYIYTLWFKHKKKSFFLFFAVVLSTLQPVIHDRYTQRYVHDHKTFPG